MAEMIRDGHTGWLADQPTSEHLAQALRRALEIPPDRMSEMGSQASDEIEQICSPRSVLEKHIEFRGRIVQRGAARSLYAPVKRTGWLSPSPVDHRQRRPPRTGLKLIDVFKLAREHPRFFFEMMFWVLRQVRKKFQVHR
jgi:hypothetical protein